MSEDDRWSPSAVLLTFAIVVAAVAALFAAESRNETVSANSEFRMCATKWAEAFSNSTTNRSKAAQTKDAADWEVKQLAIGQHLPLSDPLVQTAYRRYDAAAIELQRVRMKPPPRFQDYCK